MRRIYNPEDKIGIVKTTIFQLEAGAWQRIDNDTIMKCYSLAEVQAALENVGFRNINVYNAESDLGMSISGKVYIVCHK